mmetsp:Transcript_13261/g.19826  ORF Transcript_13261/g.19826 Transcript_13261/m.19826 type:complete len:212 (+) Transcript_13261:157-792(+)|eukprot:CAMPEP_0167758148 /NCGR_PEP_ID=MMETSP0110_2-20121227/10311_1 /TAXON_ID=629695 /ORGANISM="Gymnochlora sp., Strain CCMP2014" /LENGTH=211 /DNA_ID=CAMNT_0007644399 /DNA_START=43 /DNA_END=678 /DNA_ORIENTATION=-
MGIISGTPIPPIVPNADAMATGNRLRIVIVFHWFIAIGTFTINWFSAIIECIFAAFGMASVRSNLGYRAHWLRCYFWYCMASLIVDILFIILFYAGVYTIEPTWRKISFQIISFVGLFVYTAGFQLGRKLWSQLLNIIRHDLEGAMHGGHTPGVGGVLGVTDAYPVNQAYPQVGVPVTAVARPENETERGVPTAQPVGGYVEAVPVSGPVR